MSDVKIKATVVADTAKIKANIEKIRPVIKVNVDTSSIRKQVEKALANIQMPQNLISASSTEALTRSSPDIQSRINAAPPMPVMSSNAIATSNNNDESGGGLFDTVSSIFGTVTGMIGTYDTIKSLTNRVGKNLG